MVPLMKIKMEENRVIFIQDIYDISNAIQSILQYNCEDSGIARDIRTPIKIIFNYCREQSEESEVYYGLANIIKMSNTPVIGVILHGCVGSCATAFLTCDDRLAFENSFLILYCDGKSGIEEEKAAKIPISYHIYQQNESFLEGLIGTNLHEGFWYINTDLALKLKIIRKIIDDIDEIL